MYLPSPCPTPHLVNAREETAHRHRAGASGGNACVAQTFASSDAAESRFALLG